jgi:hypothetical protein
MMSKGKAYFMYKSLSRDLFTHLPQVPLDGIEAWPTSRVGKVRQLLYIGFQRNSRCAELRRYYRDTFVDPSLRDEQHEIAILEAERCAHFYETQLHEMGRKLTAVSDGSGATDPVETPPQDSAKPYPNRRDIRRVRRVRRKLRKVRTENDSPKGSDIGEPTTEPSEFSLVQDEAYKRAEAFYDALSEKVRHAAMPYVKTLPEMLLSTLVHCVISMYARKSQTSGELSRGWWETALLRMRNASDFELR